jgi:hypothetical protein
MCSVHCVASAYFDRSGVGDRAGGVHVCSAAGASEQPVCDACRMAAVWRARDSALSAACRMASLCPR